MNWHGFFIMKSGIVKTLPPGADHSALKPRWYQNGLIRVRIFGGSKFQDDGRLCVECRSLSAEQRRILPVYIGSWLAQNWVHEIVFQVGKAAPLIVNSPNYRIRKFELEN